MDLMPIRSVEEMEESRMDTSAPEGAGGDSGYRGGEQKCYLCASFEEPSRCEKGVNGGEVDPEGSCGQFEAAGDDETEGDYDGADEDEIA